MAEAITTFLVDNLAQVAATKIASLLGVTKEMENLSSEFDAIKKVLQDAETRQIGDESVRGWVQKLKGIAYDLEDLLEEWRICFGDHQVRNSSSSNLTSLIDQLKQPFRQLKYRERVDEIKSRLEQIAAEKERYGFSDDTCVRRMWKKRRTDPLVGQTSVRRMREERDRESWVDETSVIGRDEDKKTLVTKLISEEGSVTCGSGSDKVPTIFVSGMGGLGKTTLAKSVFNDQRVKEHFDKCTWVCVGEAFNMEDIMKNMIESWGESVKPSRGEQLREMLKDRKFLLILDDVWKVHYLQWEPLQEILNQGAKGSRIVITTRNRGVVAGIRSAYTHELKSLNEDECLLIFRKVVVEQGMEEEYEPLMDIGRKIVGKCGGLPLAVKTVASAVRGRGRIREQWEMVQSSRIWDLPQPDEGILPALMLSYTELTLQLKNCFGYCSIFEKGTLLEKDELVRLWVSQGYIVVNDGQREEEVGEECFEELLARSMFQEPERDDDGTIWRCKMHDLVHSLAQWVTKEECPIIVSSRNDDANDTNNALSRLAGARHCVVRGVLIGDIHLAGVENVRTLSYSNWRGKPIDSVFKSLKSIRVLKLRDCSVSRHSWEHLGKLVHLRHLNVEKCDSLVNLPKTIVSLPHLQVINLRYCSHLKELPELKDLSSLRQLNVEGCASLVNLPKTIVSLPHLQVINLRYCPRLKELPELKDLSSLRQLNVIGCTSLVNLPKTIVSLPHLQVINLRNCSSLEELPDGIPAMDSLRRLNVQRCKGLKKLPNGIRRQKDVVVILDGFPVVAASRDAGGGSSSSNGGGGCRSNIGDLGGRNVHIAQGYLHICNLEEVGSRDEARTAKLEKKTSLRSLYLCWNEMRDFITATDDVIAAAADGVLEGLRPPPHLLFLRIQDYPGQTFPSWMGDGGAAFRRLQEVVLWNCKNCYQLPPLGQLPSLFRLTIAGLDGVERVGREFFDGPSPTFPCLKYLTFERMRNWSEWVALSPISSEGEEGSAESPIMPALESLQFIDCPKLEAMPPIFTTSLRRLTVDDSSPMLYHRSSLQFLPLPLYETIAIVGGDLYDADDPLICVVIDRRATELPGSLLLHHTALRMLILADVPCLRSLPKELTQLTALQQLLIRNCPGLRGRCRVGGGLWPKIAHIPLIRIDGQDIRSA